MLKSEVLDVGSNETYTISYFEDDTIETMRTRIANTLNSHPDRLFILVGIKLAHDYYLKDPRRVDALFTRLSYNRSPIDQIPFQDYLSAYRSPPISLQYQPYEESVFLKKPSELDEIHSPTRDFVEYRIFGVEDVKSYILPFNFNNPGISKIPAAQIPLPLQKALVSTVHKIDAIVNFKVIRYDERAENVAAYYFPALTSSTPVRLSDESVSLLEKNTTLLRDLFAIEDIIQPEKTSITRIKFYASFAETDFGKAVRTRFEQIFYGVTLSEEVPCVTYFTSQNEVSRHKFFVKDPKRKTISLKFPDWKQWASRSPYRNQPTLIFYRGTSSNVYDRIYITPTDIVIMLFRENKKNTKTVTEMKKEVLKWLKKFDAVMSFVNENDIDEERWETQDIQFVAKYDTSLSEIDTRRLNCVSSLFNQPNRSEWKFNILRTDRRTNLGVTPIEMKIIQMKKEGVVRPTDVAKELNISMDDAKRTLEDVERKIEENPSLPDRLFQGFPSIELKNDEIFASSVTDVDRIIKYGSMLRYIVGYPDDKIDRICPKRMETVTVDTGVAPTETVDIDQAFADQYGDLFGYLEEAPQEEAAQPVEQEVEKKAVSGKQQDSSYGYFLSRLLDFDENTFDTKGSQYPKKCQKPYQPIIMSEKDLQKVDGEEYDPRLLPEERRINLDDPTGVVICPEYWCTRDQIPLTEEQLDLIDGEQACPVCLGKVRLTDKEDPREYTVRKRKEGYIYPYFLDEKYKSTKTGKLMPCCGSKPRKIEKIKSDDKYYIVLEGKEVKELRISYLKDTLLQSLNIKQDYDLFKKSNNRIANGMGGFFRIGLKDISKNIPILLGLKTKIPSPHEVPELTLKCSFVRSWNSPGETHLTAIDKTLSKVSPYDKDTLVRESLTKLISGISEAYEAGMLSKLQELEYVAVVLQMDVFRLFPKTNTLGCFFYSQVVKPRTRGIVVLQDGNMIDVLGYVIRAQRDFTYKVNIFESPFTVSTYSTVEALRTESCRTTTPNLALAMGIIRDILAMSGKDDFQIILDPYGRGQAFYIPNTMILPFQPVVMPLDMSQVKLSGYSAIGKETLPKYSDVRKYLETAETYSEGYTWSEDLSNTESKRVEVLLKSGLRIPVYPESVEPGQPMEIIETTTELGETNLVFGAPSEEIQTEYTQVNYSTEIYEFLVYQLTKDIEDKEEDLRSSLVEFPPKVKQIEPFLRKWFDATTEFIKPKEPINFVSKIRTPCGQFTSKTKCTGNLCAWNGKTCKIQVRDSINKEKLFHRLLTTLVDNSKIRAMVLDGRTSPFFTTVLFLELPNELILTDLDLVNVVI